MTASTITATRPHLDALTEASEAVRDTERKLATVEAELDAVESEARQATKPKSVMEFQKQAGKLRAELTANQNLLAVLRDRLRTLQKDTAAASREVAATAEEVHGERYRAACRQVKDAAAELRAAMEAARLAHEAALRETTEYARFSCQVPHRAFARPSGFWLSAARMLEPGLRTSEQ